MGSWISVAGSIPKRQKIVAATQGANTTLYFGSLVEQVNGSPVQYYYAGPLLVTRKDASITTSKRRPAYFRPKKSRRASW